MSDTPLAPAEPFFNADTRIGVMTEGRHYVSKKKSRIAMNETEIGTESGTITNGLDVLEHYLGELGAAITDLEGRLFSILTAEDDASDVPGDRGGSSPMASRLETDSRIVLHMVDRLRDLRGRVDI